MPAGSQYKKVETVRTHASPYKCHDFKYKIHYFKKMEMYHFCVILTAS